MGGIPGFMIAGTGSGSGKTSWTLGLIAALRRKGLAVQPFKSGPDYIDPGLHSIVAGRFSRNLDTRLIPSRRLKSLYASACTGADVAIAEAVMGYYDGSGVGNAAGSGWSLARTLSLPVALIVDISGTYTSAAATALGFLHYRRPSRIAGILLNRAGSESHYRLAKAPVEDATGLPVLGWLPQDPSLALPERHLGLVAGAEVEGFDTTVSALADRIGANVDLDRLLAMAATAGDAGPVDLSWIGTPPRPQGSSLEPHDLSGRARPVIAVARDEAFTFYYQDNLDILERLGARLVFFSPLADTALPEGANALYLGGGYPELHAQALGANSAMRDSIRRAITGGLPTFAECGGYMYLCRSFDGPDGTPAEGVGVVPGDARMKGHFMALGYHEGVTLADTAFARRGERLLGHCFHWSSIENRTDDQHALDLRRASGKNRDTSRPPERDGFCRDALFASYLHIHFATHPAFARRFVKASLAYSGAFAHSDAFTHSGAPGQAAGIP